MVTVATETSQFPGTPVSRGMPNVLINTISMEEFTKGLVEIHAAIQEGTLWMGHGVSLQIGL